MSAEPKRVVYIPPDGWVKGKGHRVSFVFEGENFHRPTGGGDIEPWYWGDSNDPALSLTKAEETAEKYNSDRGHTREEVDDIVNESMFPGYVSRKKAAAAREKKKEKVNG